MPALGLLTGTHRASEGGRPTLPLRNLFATAAVTEPTQFILRSRPQVLYAVPTATNSEISMAAFQQDGVLDGHLLVVSGGYYIGTTTEPLTGNFIPSIAGNSIGAVVTAGSRALFDDGSTVRNVTFPDDARVLKVAESQGRFIFLRNYTQRYYWTKPLANALDGSGDLVIDGLDFASAESEPDELRDMLVYKAMLVLLGRETIEFHAPTGNDDLPWSAMVGNTIDSGVLKIGCATLWNNTFAWIGQDYSIYRYNGVGKEKISTEGVEEVLRAAGKGLRRPRLDSFNFDGHEFLRVWVNDDQPDFLLDAETGEWCEWSTDGGEFIGGPTFKGEADDALYFLHKNELRLLRLHETVFDYGSPESTVEHLFRAGVPADGGAIPMHNVLLRCQTGLAGATIEMRFSSDKGKTWSNWRSISLANIRKKVEWRSLGMFDQPGALFEFRTVGATEFAVSGAMFNEFVQGRGRG